MRNLAFFCVGLLLILLQANAYRVIGPMEEVVYETIGPWLGWLPSGWTHGMSPNLMLPLVIFLGVHEPSMARGALLAFGFGYALDILAAAPMWLFTFVFVALWWLARVASIRIMAQTTLTRIPLVFVFAIIEGGMVLTLLAVFGSDNRRPLEIATVVVPRAIMTALVSPPIFRLAQRLNPPAIPAAPGAAQATTA
jgi:rod shape-determining protein MreD